MTPAAPPPMPTVPTALDYTNDTRPGGTIVFPPSPDGPVSLAYASNADQSVIIAAAPALRYMVPLAVTSGLCVASCFLLIGTKMDPLSITGHVLVYAITLTLAGFVGRRLAYALPASPTRVTLDLVAGSGLLIIGLLPVFLTAATLSGNNPHAAVLLLLTIAFGLMACTTYRHLLLYRELARLFHLGGRGGVGRLLTVVGWIKTIYEGLWLSCCFLGLALWTVGTANMMRQGGEGAIVLALGALFGAIGFTAVWLLMIVAHSIAASVAGRAARA